MDAEKPLELFGFVAFANDVLGVSAVDGFDFRSPDGPITQ
jgi:hypothetical protein